MTQPEDNFTAAPFEVLDEEGSTDRRRLAAIGVVAALLLGAAGYFLIGGGGGSSDESFVVPSTRRVVKPVGGPRKPVVVHAVLPPTSTVKLGRDPFHPLYVIPAAPIVAPLAPGATGGTSTTGTGTTGTGTAGTGTTSTGTTSTPPKPVSTTYALKLSRVDGTGNNLTARFLIGQAQKIQYARAGSVFGRSAEIRLLSIQKGPNGAGTAVIQVGDGSPFDISTSDSAIFVQ